MTQQGPNRCRLMITQATSGRRDATKEWAKSAEKLCACGAFGDGATGAAGVSEKFANGLPRAFAATSLRVREGRV